MINGYEKIYGAEGYKDKKKYEILTDRKLVHDLGNCLTDTSLGISTTEAYVSIIEQQIGQDEYKALRSVYADYDRLVRDIQQYQQKLQQYKEKELRTEAINKQIDDKIAQVERYDAKVNDLLENGEGNVSKNIKAEYGNFRKEISKETNSINQMVGDLFGRNAELADLKTTLKTLKQQIMKEYEHLMASRKQLEDVDLEKLNKFIDADFEAEVEQDFVDSCLLPSEEKKEGQFRKMAQAKFKMMKMEATYLMDSIGASQQLIDELKENQLKIKLPQEIVDRHSTLHGMSLVSTHVIEWFDFAFSQEAFNDYYLYVSNLVESSNYGDNWAKSANLYKKGIEMGIPYSSTSKVKHLLGEITGKIKVDYGYDMAMLQPIIEGVEYMKGGVKFNFEQAYEQESGLSK